MSVSATEIAKGEILIVDVNDPNIAAGINTSAIAASGSTTFLIRVTDEVYTYVENGVTRHLLGHGKVAKGPFKGVLIGFLPSSGWATNCHGLED